MNRGPKVSQSNSPHLSERNFNRRTLWKSFELCDYLLDQIVVFPASAFVQARNLYLAILEVTRKIFCVRFFRFSGCFAMFPAPF